MMKAPLFTHLALLAHGALCVVGVLLALPHAFAFGEVFYRLLNLDGLLLIEKCLVTAHTALSIDNSVADILGVYLARCVVALPFMLAAFVIGRGTSLILRWLLVRVAAAPGPQEGVLASR